MEIVEKNGKKKIIIITVLIVIIIALVIVAIKVAPIISEKMEFDEVKNKVSKIKADEFEEYLIQELKNSKINLNTDKNIERDLTKRDRYYKYETKFSKSDTGFIEANIKATECNKNSSNFKSTEYIVNIPCFKIEKDANGNFVNIKYIANDYMNTISIGMEKAIKNVLSNKYEINTNYFTRMRSRYTDICNEDKISANTFIDFNPVFYGFSDYDMYDRYYKEESIPTSYYELIDGDSQCYLKTFIHTFGLNINK